MMFFCSSFIVFQHVSIWHALLRALWHMTLDSEMNCRPIWGRSRMISPPSLASRGQTHRVWSTWLSWCRNDHEILLVVYHCARFLGKHRRCARGLYNPFWLHKKIRAFAKDCSYNDYANPTKKCGKDEGPNLESPVFVFRRSGSVVSTQQVTICPHGLHRLPPGH